MTKMKFGSICARLDAEEAAAKRPPTIRIRAVEIPRKFGFHDGNLYDEDYLRAACLAAFRRWKVDPASVDFHFIETIHNPVRCDESILALGLPDVEISSAEVDAILGEGRVHEISADRKVDIVGCAWCGGKFGECPCAVASGYAEEFAKLSKEMAT